MTFLLGSAASAAPYGKDGMEIDWTQPDGTKLSLRVFGDEHYARTETTDGYTVIYDPTDQAYHYAELAADGETLVANATKADAPPPQKLAKRISQPPATIRAIHQKNYKAHAGDRDERWRQLVRAARLRNHADAENLSPPAAEDEAKKPSSTSSKKVTVPKPVSGPVVGLTILIQFPDDPATAENDPVSFPVSRAKITRFCNEVGYTDDGNTGSVRDYFFDQSLGALTYTQLVKPIVTMPQPRNFYNYSDYPTNTKLSETGDTARLLLNTALTTLKDNGFDFDGLSLDGQQKVIATNVLYAGPDSGVWAQGLWAHAGSLTGSGFKLTPGASSGYALKYQITNIANSSPTIGTFCHENGHMVLGYPDLYDYGQDSAGVGDHCLMGGGNHLNGGKTPAPINAYLKDISGWANVTDIDPLSFVPASLPSTGNVAYRIRKPGLPSEYFIIENHGPGDRWATALPDQGIAIWHIDETVEGNDDEDGTSGSHYQVALEQADGKFGLEANSNGGNDTDLFDAETPSFSDYTRPNARWWDGTASNIDLTVNSAPGSNMSVLFGVFQLNDSILFRSSLAGLELYPGESVNLGWRGKGTGNVKIELLKGGAFHSVISLSQPVSGIFKWTVPPTVQAGDDYAVRISSTFTPTIRVTSPGLFTILNDTIEIKTPLAGVEVFRGNILDLEWLGHLYHLDIKGVKIDLLKGGVFHSVISPSQPESGDFEWTVPFGIPSGEDYAVRISSFANPSTFVTSEGFFTIRAATLANALGTPSSWSWGVSGNTSWTVQYTNTHDGVAAVRSGVFPGETSKLRATITGPGVLSYWYSLSNSIVVSLRVTVDGVQMQEFTEPADWTRTELEIPAGSHEVEWINSKPSFNEIQQTQARLDDVVFTPHAPEIKVTGNGGIEVIPEAPPLDMGTVTVGSNFFEWGIRTFTIKNEGALDLTGLSVILDGEDRGSFLLGNLAGGVTELAPGESTAFSVFFDPDSEGPKSASLRIFSNDPSHPNFGIELSGTGLGVPKIAVLDPADHLLTDSAGSVNLGSSVKSVALPPAVFIVSNEGSTSLSGLAITKDGAHAGDFTIGALGVTVLAPGETTTFTVTFKPGATGTRSAELHLSSNDPNHSPFDIALAGTGLPPGSIAVRDMGDKDLTSGNSVVELGQATVSASLPAATFTVTNEGGGAIDDLSIAVGGVNPSDFTIGSLASTTLAPGASTTFTVIFKPTAVGVRTAVLLLSDPSKDVEPFEFAVRGIGLAAPEIAVSDETGTEMTDGSASADFAGGKVGMLASTKEFKMTNTGSGSALGLRIKVTGPNASDFSVSAIPTSLASGARANFVISFTPSGSGPRSAELQIASSNGNGNPFDITLTGLGHTPLEHWRFTHFGTISNTGSAADTADWDLDGSSNLIEYAFLTDPRSANPSPFRINASADSVELTYPENKAATDLNFTIEASPDLLDWRTAAFTRLADDNGGVLSVTATIIPEQEPTNRFYRLKVTVNP